MRQLIEQMLDCIEELKYSNDTFTSQFKSNAAITAAREYLAQPEQSEQCTESDSWNCKYCRKTETCKALQDPRNFGKPKAPEPVSQMLLDLLARAHDEMLDGSVGYDIRDEIMAVLAAQRSKE